MENKTGFYGAIGSSGISGTSGKIIINGLTHYISKTLINGEWILTKDEVELDGKRMEFSEYIKQNRDNKINQLID